MASCIKPRARLAHNAVLGEGDDLNVDDAAKFLAHADQRLDAFEPGLAIDVGEGANVQRPMKCRQRDGASCVLGDPGFAYFSLILLASSMAAIALAIASP